jgi:hypothetical protein
VRRGTKLYVNLLIKTLETITTYTSSVKIHSWSEGPNIS